MRGVSLYLILYICTQNLKYTGHKIIEGECYLRQPQM